MVRAWSSSTSLATRSRARVAASSRGGCWPTCRSSSRSPPPAQRWSASSSTPPTQRPQPRPAWLIAGAVAIGLLGLIPAERSLADAIRLASVYRPLTFVLAASAAIALAAGFLALAPWALALLLVAILTGLWFLLVAWLVRAGAWGESPID